MAAVITGSGVYTPPHRISNEELVHSFNAYVAQWNAGHADAIARGELCAKQESSAEFIVKAAGIRSRYVVEKEGVLDVRRMRPDIPERGNDEMSLQVEMALAAAGEALQQAGREASDIDMILSACSGQSRGYPALAIELQHHLGAGGYAFDMNVACSSTTFAIKTAADAIKAGSANCVLVVTPEVGSAHVNYRDRDSHFIFGDVAVALLVEREERKNTAQAFRIVGHKLATQYSNNIRSNQGVFNRLHPDTRDDADKMFVQEGRKVFKEVCPMVGDLILAQLAENAIAAAQLNRLWLHQANINMNDFIARKILGREPQEGEAPLVLDTYANTGGAGSIIAFHQHKDGFAAGDYALLCSFGAGYSIGSLLLQAV